MDADNRSNTNKGSACFKIFIVDPTPIVRDGLTHLINQQTDFMVCGEAANAASALKDIKENEPDIVITDLLSGNGIGISFIKDIAIRFSNIHVLVFSIHDESIFAGRCLTAGARGYVMKTASSGEIIFAINKIREGRICFSDQVQNKLLSKFYQKKPDVEIFTIESLSDRELEVFQLVGSGLKIQQIADELSISVKTIGSHVERIKRKMNLNNTREVFMHAVHWLSGSNLEKV